MANVGYCASQAAIKIAELMGKPDLSKRFSEAPPLTCLNDVVVAIINVALMFVGAVCLIFLALGAVKFITSGGDPKAVKSARDTMTYAVIGTIIVVLVFVIANTFATLLGIPTSALFNFRIGP